MSEKKKPRDRKTDSVTARLLPIEAAVLEGAAQATGLSESEIIRQLIRIMGELPSVLRLPLRDVVRHRETGADDDSE